MYTAYFGLSEAPFTIAPDPAYLFMSDRHREALTHLTYGLGDNGGFVLLTGEVGTGKTTVSRTVMDKLPENTQASFILNPTLSCEELLACICDNLKIRYRKTGATLKYLTDKIQNKLIKNHENNINTLLIIDEAQHLKPEVLEQLRLLTNLETNTKKLLQVILIGQPELQQLLQRRDLRQLAQRITARYHLLPLTKSELAQYIKHRLSVAHCNRALFSSSAISMLHKVSKGIPRIVNLLCDRALIIGYGKNDAVISKKIIQQAAIEALGEDQQILDFWQQPMFKVAALSTTLACVGFGGYWLGFQQENVKPTLVQVTPEEKAVTLSSSKLKDSQVENAEITNEIKNQINKVEALETTQNNANNSNEDLQSNVPAKIISADKKIDNKVIEDVVPQQPRILGYQPESVAKSLHENNFEIVAEPGVSEDLLSRFKEAVNETDSMVDESTESDESEQSFLALHQMPTEIQNALPTLQFEMHIYATEGEGWVRVNGMDKREGEQISKGVWLNEIRPQHVVLEFQEQQFTMPALSSW